MWEKFLHDTTGGDAELAAFLRRAVGYSLTGDTREEAFGAVHGLGGQAKQPAGLGKADLDQAGIVTGGLVVGAGGQFPVSRHAGCRWLNT